MKKQNIILTFLTAILILSFAMPAFAGLGISPQLWLEPHALAGLTMAKTFTLSRDDPGDDLYFTSEITGDITPWITIDKGASFVMSKDKNELAVKIIVAVPADAAFKEYKAEIRLRSATKAGNTTDAPIGVQLSALIQIDITVSDQPYSEYQVLQIAIPDQQYTKPLNVVLSIWNLGNQEAKPTKLTMDLFDKFNSVKLDAKEFIDFATLTGVPPFSEGTITLQIPSTLTPEQYWAKTDVFQDAALLKTDDITFDITSGNPQKPGAVTGSTGISTPFGNVSWLVIYIAIGVVALGIIGLIIYLIVRKSRKSKLITPPEVVPPSAVTPPSEVAPPIVATPSSIATPSVDDTEQPKI